MKSMTGFGHKDFQSDLLELDVNIRSVNGRYFELRMHLPKELVFMESRIKKIVSQNINRGTIDLYLSRRTYHPNHQKLKIESKMAKNWVASLKKLSQETGIAFQVSLFDLAQLPGVSYTQENLRVPLEEQKVILKVIEDATKICVEERRREGIALKKELLDLLNELQKTRSQMEKLRVLANEELASRFKEKLKKWTHYDENRLAFEISNPVDKSDINEEILRLNEHIKGCKTLLNKKDPVGKKLDFYSQEILREINTIGSKSQVSRLTEAVVDAKSLIERFREQVQNIE